MYEGASLRRKTTDRLPLFDSSNYMLLGSANNNAFDSNSHSLLISENQTYSSDIPEKTTDFRNSHLQMRTRDERIEEKRVVEEVKSQLLNLNHS